MERDPVRFVWRHARGPNALIGAIAVLLVMPMIWTVLAVVRTAADDALIGRAFTDGATTPFLRIALTLPERLLQESFVLSRGIPVGRADLIVAIVITLALAAVIAAICVWAVGMLQIAVASRVNTALRQRLLDAIVSAPLRASEAARHAAQLAGDALADGGDLLGRAIASPALAGAALLASLLFLLLTDWRMALVVAIGLGVVTAAARFRHRADEMFGQARHTAGATLRRRLDEVALQLPAISSHGTARSERDRLDRDVEPALRPLHRLERRVVLGSALASMAACAVPLGVLALGLWSGGNDHATPGSVAAAAVAGVLCLAANAALIGWGQDIARARPIFDEMARTLGALNARRNARERPALPPAGLLLAESLAASEYGHGSGRLAGLDLSLRLPAHVALTGEPGSGSRIFAALIGGQIAAASGRLTFAGVELADADPADRALRLAFAGGEPYLMAGSLRANLLYGCPDPDAADIDRRLQQAVAAASLDAFVHARGLSATIDPRRDAALAEALVEARRAIRTALAERSLDGLVEAFDASRYNAQASLGENILFGVPIGDTFREDSLPAQPFMRALLEQEGLAKPLAAIGAAVAQSALELFAELPNRSALLDRFAPIAGTEREELERLLERRQAGRRGSGAARDSERLIGLALRYSESRQRLGLLGPELVARILRARGAFAATIPDSLKSAIEFFDADRICAAASLRDNLLFGRVVHSQAGAEQSVLELIRRVLHRHGLDDAVTRIGLDARLVAHPGEPTAQEAAAIDLARCLVRQPDTLVVEHALDGLSSNDATALIGKLMAAMDGRGLLIVLPDALAPVASSFDCVVRFENGKGWLSGNGRGERQAGMAG